MKKPEKVEALFEILNECDIHSDSNYKTIVFSDTLLAYNLHSDLSPDSKVTEVMFLIELVHDIAHRLTGLDIFFRAVITEGEFKHTQLTNFDSYFGQALVATHDLESKLPGFGLYLTDEIDLLNKYYPSTPCGSNLHFSFLAYDLLKSNMLGEFTTDYPRDPLDTMWEEAGIQERVLFQIEYLKKIYQGKSHPKIHVRAKYDNVWALYGEKDSLLIKTLVDSNFDPMSLCEIDWSSAQEHLKNQIN